MFAALTGCALGAAPAAPERHRTSSGTVGTQASACGATASSSKTGDSLALSFIFIGCNRVAKEDWNPGTNPSSANVPQLQQTLTDVSAMRPIPRFLFFMGDLVSGLVHGTSVLESQLNGWSRLYRAHSVESKLALLPIAGNHELLFETEAKNGQFSNAPADAVWTHWLTTNGFDTRAGNGPRNVDPNSDDLVDDQSKLSYSFDDGSVHFVMLNTDTLTSLREPGSKATRIGWIPLEWLKRDLAAAQTNPHISAIFVFGHKPIVAPKGSTSSNDAIHPLLTSAIEEALDGTPKVKAYFAAHAHEWDARRLPGARGIYQVIAGNGGSPIDDDWTANPPYYGFSEARVYANGRISVVSYRRPVPTPYIAPDASAAEPAPEITIVAAP